MSPLRLLVAWAMLVVGGAARAGADEAAGGRSPDPAQLDVQEFVFLGPMRPLLVRLRVLTDGKPFRRVWRERFDELFDQEDREHDGRVTIEQAESIARDMNGSLRDATRLSEKDSPLRAAASGDGTLDRALARAAIEKIYPPFLLRQRTVGGSASALALFPLLDANHDRQLEPAELAAALAQLRQRDFNDDGMISRGELILDPGAVAGDAAASDVQISAADGPLLLVDGATSGKLLAERLLARYDRNHDGRLSRMPPEIGLPPALYAWLDANGDGALDAGELARLAQRQADLELIFTLGQVTAAQARRKPPAPSDDALHVRKRLDGGYDLKLGEANIKFRRSNRDPRQADLANFRNVDRDNNSYLDSSEASAGNIGTVAFAAMDSDGDGKVFRGEFTSYTDRQNTAAALRLQLAVSDFGQDLFDLLDVDEDELLSPRELRFAAKILQTADTNGDGRLNGDEIPQTLEFELVRGLDERNENVATTPVSKRPARSAAQASTAGPLWFRKMDRNNDGDLSPQEFVGPVESFGKLDANGDGFIDVDEAEAAGK